jgi:uncharacterized protein DUF4235
MSKMQYKALGLLVGVLGGMLASAIVRKVWEFTPGHDEAPEAIDTRRSWGEILTAAALQGAIGWCCGGAPLRAGEFCCWPRGTPLAAALTASIVPPMFWITPPSHMAWGIRKRSGN